ncbi:hypothetical protein CYY_006074 [Polysphondylium violaceum]|uniref:Thioredoxin n=1 Tax=Polysphondylium violaceum TaxID=133409 RepID=A0A8J4UYE3_9MYCE|nr:hypothetical protein CYY_006074 [Polysphondylium violaceum]
MSIVKIIERDSDFEPYIQNTQLVLAVFSATWCGPCKALEPIVEKIAQDYQGRVSVCKIDIDDCTQTTNKYSVRSVPTCLVFVNGQKSASLAGLTSRENIIRALGI